MSTDSNRTETFRRNDQLESLLTDLNSLLRCAEEEALASLKAAGEAHPVVFIMGPLRSGTTLFMQWLANSGIFAYPTNLLSRFYGAPLIGAKIQLLLTDPRYNFRNEIPDFGSRVDFYSENGKTEGALSPNEFWYFWRRFLPFEELDWLPDEDLMKRVDHHAMVNELVGLTTVFDKPFALKGMILNYNIPFLDALFDKALFVQIKRDPITNVSSILDARKRQLGSESAWYSFKIPEYSQLKDMSPVMQAAGQCHYINQAVDEGISKLAESRKLVVEYESFCREPARVFDQLCAKLGLLEASYHGPDSFEATRGKNISRRDEIRESLNYFTRNPI